MIAAIFVQTNGVYFGLPHVDPWDAKRDATKYAGPYRVVAHPPCARWCRLAGLVEKRWGKKRGEDGGLFESALNSVRTWGGVLEHPAYSDAWPHFLLPAPPRHGGWARGICGGWACHVEQSRYGHQAKKATWLYAFGVEPPPDMRWGSDADSASTAPISWCGNRVASGETRRRLGKSAASSTPPQFRDALIALVSFPCAP